MENQEISNEAQTNALSLEGLGIRFGGLEILHDVTFSIAKGERCAIIGPNGAGKTTLFNMIAGELSPTSGSIGYFQKDITSLPGYKRVWDGIIRTYQKNNLLNKLSVLENLLLVLQRKKNIEHSWFKPRTPKKYPELFEEAERLLSTWGLLDERNTIVSNLSYGAQRQVEILLGIATDPKVLLLDEPTAGMSTSETSQVLKLLKSMSDELTMVIIEHDMELVFNIAERVIVLHDGGILAEGSPEDIQSNEHVYEVYFGKEGVL